MAGAGPGRQSRPFAVTCALLRQYMRENESQRQVRMGNLDRVLQAPPSTPVAPQENDEMTMQLFPVHAAAAMAQPAAHQERPEVVKVPMTIFYGGQVMYFDHIPADKANGVMQMAGSSLNAPPPEKLVVDVPEAIEPPAGGDQQTIARKASLQRFLQKRKRRGVGGNNPDDHNEDAAAPAKKIDAGGGSGEYLEDVPDALWLRL
ncbi:hypothetical protein C2845_PM01G44630 [Panicum miliaceum]|uniref:Protein TIFY n=1 Tax=Panicum miliaceum TaxID=4540 RepID=A0A3L6TGB6_PANMI|nr:hypothetical protein C2845_PM01G44630 [Panicum miliaceum]